VQRIVLYARGKAPDLLGTQRHQAKRVARLFSHLKAVSVALPEPGVFKPLGAAFRELSVYRNAPPLMSVDPYALTLLP
jgi:hypothetical protein